MSCIVFKTPGLIDMRAFTVLGMSAKPNSTNPIGMFGSGIKYAMAVLVRLGCEPEVWIGRDRHVFVKTQDQFRGKDFDMLSIRSMRWGLSRWRTTRLPFTTQYGRNWEPWMVFRELEANTRDEGGETYYSEHQASQINGEEGCTMIVVDLPAFVDAWRARDEIFLPNAGRGGSDTVEVFDGPSDYLYWRGMRVYKLPEPSRMTYNFIAHMVLTEDRTLAHEYYARAVLARFIVKCTSDQVVETVLTANSKFWEHGLDFDGTEAPGEAFKRIMRRMPGRVGASAHNYWAGYDTRVTADTYMLDDVHPLPWSVSLEQVRDKNGRSIFGKPYDYVGKWDLAAGALVRRVNAVAPAEEEQDEPLGDPAQGEDEEFGATPVQ